VQHARERETGQRKTDVIVAARGGALDGRRYLVAECEQLKRAHRQRKSPFPSCVNANR
jgi:hypothetical protein